ncbi:unnamed protein product [Effrenium voratum]|nr:unnamed protein product [Effrenium voratum]
MARVRLAANAAKRNRYLPNDIITSLSQESRWQHSLVLLRTEGPSGKLPLVYQQSLEACRQGLQWDWCVQLLAEMRTQSLRPSATAFSMCASACGRAAQWRSSVAALRAMEDDGLARSLKTWSAAMSGCGEAQEWEAALALLWEADRSMQLDTMAWNAAMAACRKRAWEVTLALLSAMAKKLTPSVVSLALCAEVCHWRQALALLEDAGRLAVRPDLVLVNATAASAARGGAWEAALALAAQLPARQLKPDIVMVNTVLAGFSASSHWAQTLALLAQLPRQSLRPKSVTFNTAMSACLRASQWHLVSELFEEMQRRQLKASDSTVNALCGAFERRTAWQAALHCAFGFAPARGIKLSSLSLAPVVSACRKAAQWAQVLELLRHMEASSLALDDCFRAARMASEMESGDLPTALARHREQPRVADRGAWRSRKFGHLDLHQLQPQEACLAVCCALLDAVEQPPPLPAAGLTLVTGKGSHSPGGEGLLQPAVQQFLREMSIETLKLPNPGRLAIPRRELEAFLSKNVYTFHRSNIHERRPAATFARLVPLFSFLLVVAVAAIGFALCDRLLLALCAILNTSLCLGMSYSGVLCLLGVRKVAEELRREAAELPQEDGIQHVIIIANYKEDLEMLAQTLTSLAQAHGCQGFHVVLAMEAREGVAAREKAAQLTKSFSQHFASLRSTHHPEDLVQEHKDGSWDPEIPGKASNLKWAVREVYGDLLKAGNDASSLLLTVADADVLFHPRYFNHIAHDFSYLRRFGGGEHEWTLWQAPQLPFRNYFASPACSRVWAYVASMYEFGGVAGLSLGGDHFVFSTYSMPFRLAVEAEAHEGDVIAEADSQSLTRARRALFQQCTGYPRGETGPDADGFLWDASPVKATSVVSDGGACQTWIDRWFQAKRHAQGVAEVSTIVLAALDASRQLPRHAWTTSLAISMARMAGRLMYIHMLPSCQFVAMFFLTLDWLCSGFKIELCSTPQNSREVLLCGAAGIWNPAWPAVPITVFIILGSISMVSVSYLRPLEQGHYRSSIWTSEAAGLPTTCGSALLTLVGLVVVDCFFYAGLLVLPYGIVVEILAFWNVAFRGNRFEYVTATKAHADGAGAGSPSGVPMRPLRR